MLVKVQAAASQGPMWRRELKPLGTKLKPNFGFFLCCNLGLGTFFWVRGTKSTSGQPDRFLRVFLMTSLIPEGNITELEIKNHGLCQIVGEDKEAASISVDF